MQITSRTVTNSIPEKVFSGIAPLSDVLYVDIETTGLSGDRDRVYLIGVAAYASGVWTITQWFDDKGDGETNILTSFLIYAKDYSVLVHYNGDRFDLPFLKSRIQKNQLGGLLGADGNLLENMKSIDLFRAVRPFKKILALENYKQATLEAYLGVDRGEDASGGDLIEVYKKYTAAPTLEEGNAILSHNASDVEGLLSVSAVLALKDILSGDDLVVKKAQADSYQDASGQDKSEIVLFCSSAYLRGDAFPSAISASSDDCYLNIHGDRILIRVPLVEGELRYFYANYQDYYYLPAQDQAMHKSIASFVDKSHRVQAKAETCYTRKTGTFLPEWDVYKEPFYKKEYREKGAWFEFLPEMKRDREFFNEYARYVFGHIVKGNM